ncbi:hypothetical protein [Methylomusa anaerophila]|uniref:hypothetical protein n=1 Tax=Methylomusa anaerophila TaxID=1930071 RepID=UPI001E2C7676|nr:hypothetical protein [Methylomusa anaerophila]
MIIEYKDKKLEKICTNLREAKKKYSGRIPEALLAAINFINEAETLRDVIQYPPFHFHDLGGNMAGLYTIDIAGRKSGF